LNDRRRALVPFQDPEAIARKTIELLDTPAIRHAMRKRAYLYSRDMVWKKVAQGYMASFARARSDRMQEPRVTVGDVALDKSFNKLPALDLGHLLRLTDDTGLLQHATFAVPNYAEGYTTDDNARALILTVLLEQLNQTDPRVVNDLASRYLAFLGLALNPANGRFRNFLSYTRVWNEQEQGSEDCHGRALWALGAVLGRSGDQALRGAAGRLFEMAVPVTLAFTSPRAWAFALLGVEAYLESFSGDRDAKRVSSLLSTRLVDHYKGNQSSGWHWFEDVLAYSNARLPQALLIAGDRSSNHEMLSIGLEALNWLDETQRFAGQDHYVPIGSQGFYRKNGERARFDQQPIEAGGTVSACLEAHRITGDDRWRRQAWSAFNWFLGSNDLQIPLYDPSTGGCRDGLHPERVNENQGAESTLAFLMSQVEMRRLGEVDVPRPGPELVGTRSANDNVKDKGTNKNEVAEPVL